MPVVANPAVADAVTRTARRIYLFGRSGRGEHLRIRTQPRADRQPGSLQIERDVAGLEDYIKRFIPTSDVTVELLNDNVVLTGTVETPLDSKRAADLANIFVTGGEATTGQYVRRPLRADPAYWRCRHRQSGPGNAASAQIVNLLQIIGEDQVTLQGDRRRGAAARLFKQLGVNLIAGGDFNGISWGAIAGVLVRTGQARCRRTALGVRKLGDRRLCQRHGAGRHHEDARRADADGRVRRRRRSRSAASSACVLAGAHSSAVL